MYVPYLNALAANGSPVQELRRWRFNVVANYDFRAGRLKGWSAGGGFSWNNGRNLNRFFVYKVNEGGSTVERLYQTPQRELGPLVREDTRTALARTVVTNAGSVFRPGLFITGKVTAGTVSAAVCVPRDAVQTIANKPVVFVRDAHGLEPRPARRRADRGDRAGRDRGAGPQAAAHRDPAGG